MGKIYVINHSSHRKIVDKAGPVGYVKPPRQERIGRDIMIIVSDIISERIFVIRRRVIRNSMRILMLVVNPRRRWIIMIIVVIIIVIICTSVMISSRNTSSRWSSAGSWVSGGRRTSLFLLESDSTSIAQWLAKLKIIKLLWIFFFVNKLLWI